jgi:hypothetical protein
MEKDSRSIVLQLRQKLGGQESRATAQKHSSTGTYDALLFIGQFFIFALGGFATANNLRPNC